MIKRQTKIHYSFTHRGRGYRAQNSVEEYQRHTEILSFFPCQILQKACLPRGYCEDRAEQRKCAEQRLAKIAKKEGLQRSYNLSFFLVLKITFNPSRWTTGIW